jgi:hypothetical protein
MSYCELDAWKRKPATRSFEGNLNFYSQTTFVYAIRFDLIAIVTQVARLVRRVNVFEAGDVSFSGRDRGQISTSRPCSAFRDSKQVCATKVAQELVSCVNVCV